MKPIIDAHRRMKKLAHTGFPWDRNTNPGQAPEQLDVVEEGG
jgi:hypothetical protein